jgi:spore maturation protein CgeB
MAEARHGNLTLGLYGDGWKNPAGNTLYDFAAGEAIYRKCKIAIGDQFWGQTYAFVSNRFFQALAAGAFLLQEQSSGLDEYTGLEDGVHYVSWKGHADLQLKIRYWNSPKRDRKRREIAEAGRVYVREHFNFDEQVRKLFEELLPTIQAESEAVR